VKQEIQHKKIPLKSIEPVKIEVWKSVSITQQNLEKFLQARTGFGHRSQRLRCTSLRNEAKLAANPDIPALVEHDYGI